MLQTKFKPICVFVTYKLNRISIPVEKDGISCTELIRITCTQLGMSPKAFHSFYLTRNGVVQDEGVVFYPFSQLKLCQINTNKATKPNLKHCLWQISCQVRGWKNTDVLGIMAREIYQELANEMQRLAHYGLSQATFMFPVDRIDPLDEVIIPPTWLRILKHDETIYNHREKILEYVRDEFQKDEMIPKVTDGYKWTFVWKLKPEEIGTCRITARDLTAMGYPVHSGDLFRTIHNRLKEAILTGDVHDDSLDAQKAWVRKNFPLK